MTLALYDTLTLELERAESLIGLLEDRLSELSEGNESHKELYALAVVAHHITHKLHLVRTSASVLYESAGSKYHDETSIVKKKKKGGA